MSVICFGPDECCLLGQHNCNNLQICQCNIIYINIIIDLADGAQTEDVLLASAGHRYPCLDTSVEVQAHSSLFLLRLLCRRSLFLTLFASFSFCCLSESMLG